MRDLADIRSRFPALDQKINGNALVYFDSGATALKPKQVIDALSEFYSVHNANIHRGVHTLSRRATDMFERARKTVAQHFNVANDQQLVFTSGTTDGINKVAAGLAKNYLQPGDEIILSTCEHHSNILPWQLWAQENGGVLKVIPLLPNHTLDYAAYAQLFSKKTKLVAVTHVSNTLGTITDVAHIKGVAAKHGVPVLLDGAQSAPHMKVDLAALDVDFFVCSAHKMYGPTGIGILYLSEKWLNELPLAFSGGGTIKTVSFEKTEYAEGALRLEPGTPHIAGAVGFAEALAFMNSVGMQQAFLHESVLVALAHKRLKEIAEVEVYGESAYKAGVVSFNVKGVHPFDVGTLLDNYGIAVRTGHHCTQPLMQYLGVPGTVRLSFGVYNTGEEVEYFADKLKRVIKMLV